MGFLAPWFLAGLAAIGLPVWLHLLRQHRKTPLPFSSLMFFERRLTSSVRARRLRYLFLFALRTLLFLLIALAFAEPFVQRQTLRSDDAITVLAVDRSFSMQYGRNLEAAKAEAERVLNGLPGRSEVLVLALDAHVETLADKTADHGKARQLIEAIQASALPSSFGELARVLRSLETSANRPLNGYLFSDLQRSSMPKAFGDLELGARTKLTLNPVGSEANANWQVESASASNVAGEKADRTARVRATVAGTNTGVAEENVVLAIDGKTVASKTITVPTNGRATVEFTGVDVPFGEHRGEVRIPSRDKLPQDDVYRFALHHPESQTVLCVTDVGTGASPPFYRAALESADAGLVVQSESMAQAAEAENLGRYAYVVVEQNGPISEALERRLDAYVRSGGRLLAAVGGVAETGQVPVTHGAYRTETGDESPGFLDGQQAALRGLQSLGAVHFYRYARLTPTPDSKILARLASGAPLLIEQMVGEGHVLTFAANFENRGNDFALHPSFLPFVAQVGRYLAGLDEPANSNIAGDTIELRRAREGGRPATVVGPSGKQELSLRQSAMANTFDLYAEGFYEMQRADGRRTLIAANADRRESDLTRIPEETLTLMRNAGRGTNSGTAVRSAGASLTTEAQPRLLWRVVLIAALIAALAESIVASRYWRKETHLHDVGA